MLMHKGKVGVSAHAMLRYLERVHGVDINDMVDHLVPDDLEDQMAVVGHTGKFPGPPGFRLVMKDGVVVTVITS